VQIAVGDGSRRSACETRPSEGRRSPDRDLEISAKLKYAKATLTYLDRIGENPGRAELPLVEFVSRWEERIERKREEFWPNKEGHGQHPMRWTGRGLPEDLQQVDRLEGTDLERFYETEVRRMNWQVHGSGLTGIRGLDFPTLGVVFSLAHKMSGQLALQVIRLFVEETDLLSPPELAALGEAERRWQTTVLEGLTALEQLAMSSSFDTT